VGPKALTLRNDVSTDDYSSVKGLSDPAQIQHLCEKGGDQAAWALLAEWIGLLLRCSQQLVLWTLST